MTKDDIYALLDGQGIPYERCEHAAAYTIEDLAALKIPHKERIVKNLFLRDDKKRAFYLVTVPGHKTVNLKSLAVSLCSRKLSFADEDLLWQQLALKKGHVTPLGLLNNAARNVVLVMDSCLCGQTIGVHPMENTATVFLACEDVCRLAAAHGNPVVTCDIIESMTREEPHPC